MMSKYYRVEDIEMLVVFSGICDDKTCGEIARILQSLPVVEVSEDCVNRYSVLAELDPRSYEYKAVKELPGVIPKPKEVEPKQGDWIETSEGTMCSNCHKYPYDDGEYHIANWHSDFCPNCGARMKGVYDD